MGLFKKIKQLDNALDNMVNNTVNTAINFINTKEYTSKITLGPYEVGTFRYAASDPDFVNQKISTYLSGIFINENSDIQQVYSMYLAMDHMNFGAQKQLLVMNPEAFEHAFNNFRTPLKVSYWRGVQLGDTAEEAMQKASLVKEEESGIYIMLNMQDAYFERRGYILSNDGKVDALFAYTYVDKDRKGEKAKIRLDELRNSMIAYTFPHHTLTYKENFEKEKLSNPRKFAKAMQWSTSFCGYISPDGRLSLSITVDNDKPYMFTIFLMYATPEYINRQL